MNRNEALRILGLDNDASLEDIRAAYKETAQILHPDRLEGNKKLQKRATEQFKTLQEAYNLLMGKSSSRKARSKSDDSEGLDEAELIRARLAGIQTARTQLVAQRDAALDERRTGLGFLLIGGVVALLCSRRPAGLFLAVAGLASAAALWGLAQSISAQRSISALEAHLDKLAKEKKKLLARLDQLD